MARYKVMNAGDIAGRPQRLGDIVELNDEAAKALLASGNIVTSNEPMSARKYPANPTPEEIRVRDNMQRDRDLVRGQPVTPEPAPTPEEARRRAESNPNRPFNPPGSNQANPARPTPPPGEGTPETPEEARMRRENTPDRPVNTPRDSDQHPADRRRETNPERPVVNPPRKPSKITP